MANVKISELPAASTPLSGSELVAVVQSGATKKVTAGYLAAAGAANAPSAVSVGASPFIYQNTSGFTVDVLVSGGGVSALDISRGGAIWYSAGSFYGPIPLSPGDQMRVTYVSAPSMTLIPR